MWGPARTLVERFDIEPYSDFSAKWSNFIRLALCCIDARFCKNNSLESSWRDLQDLHAFAPFRPQYFRKKSSNFFAFFGKILQKLPIKFFKFFIEFCSEFDEHFLEFRKYFSMVKNLEFFEFSSKMHWILTEFWPNSDVKSSNGSIPRLSNLST